MFSREDVETALQDARKFAASGAYEQALERHIWYHENALKFAPAHVGVRLSFAVGYWAELGEYFSPALDALKLVRDQAVAAYRKAPADSQSYFEAMSISLRLDDLATAKTLYYEGLQMGIGDILLKKALNNILDAGDLDWARDIIANPQASLEEMRRTAKRRLPGYLCDCMSRDASECELILVFSDAANEAARADRNRDNQAVLLFDPNFVMIEGVADLLDNEDVKSLIAALGAGIAIRSSLLPDGGLGSFDLDRLRYAKIILVIEQGEFESNILNELTRLFSELMHPLLDAGHVFLPETPLPPGLTQREFTEHALDPLTRRLKVLVESVA